MNKFFIIFILSSLVFGGCINQSNNNEIKEFVHEKYNYTFEYPFNIGKVFSNVDNYNPEQAFSINLIDNQNSKSIFSVEVSDPELFGIQVKSDFNPKKSLEEHVNKAWEINKTNQISEEKNEISEIEKIDLNGREAYQFKFKGVFIGGLGGGTEISEEHFFIFTANNKYSYEIWFPSDNEDAKSILKTFQIDDK